MMEINKEITCFKRAIDEEIGLIRREFSNDYLVKEGEFLNKQDNSFIYKFKTETQITLSDSFPATLKVKGEIFKAEIINVTSDTLLLALPSKVADKIDQAYLDCDATFLLQELKVRLDECKKKQTGLHNYLVEHGANDNGNYPIPGKKELESMVNKNKITFIWGPPGSGKTTTIGELTHEYVQSGKKVLIVSQSNISVDGAILKIKEHFLDDDDLVRKCRIIRHGYIKNHELNNDVSSNPRSFVKHTYPELDKRMSEIDKALNDYDEKSDEIDPIALKEERIGIFKEIDSKCKILVEEAVVIATTISKATIDQAIYKKAFDIVIFDEASMAYVPQIIFASSLATEKFLCVGDLKQLAPICKSDDLVQDIYNYLNIVDNKGKISHQWLVMLDEQYRTHPDIYKFSNLNFYQEMVKNGDIVHSPSISRICSSKPCPDQAVVLMDTTGFYASATRTVKNSRVNIVHACIAVITAIDLCKKQKKSVGIITPYHDQAKLIKKLIQDNKRNNNIKNDNDIECSTVHQFQGSERDVIILDTVENYPYEKLGLLTCNMKNDAVNRLVNVAVTRARGKLIILGNMSYWKKYAKNDNPFLRLMKYASKIDNGNVLRSTKLKKYIEKPRAGMIQFQGDGDDAAMFFIEDVDNAKSKLTVMLSKGENINEICLDKIIDMSRKNKNKTEKVAIKIKLPSKSKELRELDEYQHISKRGSLPLAMIDDKIIWYGIPDMYHVYDLQNEKIREHDKVMIRIEGAGTSNILEGLLDFKNDVDIKVRQKNGAKLKEYVSQKLCPACGGQLHLVKEKHLYTVCKKCTTKEFLSCFTVNGFFDDLKIACPSDGGKLRARIGNYGMILRCSEKHVFSIDDFFEL